MGLIRKPTPAIYGCGDPGDPIDFACLLDGSVSQFSRVMAAGDQSNWSFCAWAKSTSAANAALTFAAGPSTSYYATVLAPADIHSGNGSTRYFTQTEVDGRAYRDLAGWRFVLVNFDGSQPQADRFSYYVFDEKVALNYANVAGALGSATAINGAVNHIIGTRPVGSGYGKSYVARIIFLDGILATPDDFGYRNSEDVWVPKKYTGSYGANGFHLDFADPLNLGNDVSGNGNHFTATGLTADNQVTDTPTNNRLFMFNPLLNPSLGTATFAEGNMRAYTPFSAASANAQTTLIPPGQHYFEFDVLNSEDWIGLMKAGLNWPVAAIRHASAQFSVDGVVVAGYAPQYAFGSRIGLAYDTINKTAEFFFNGNSLTGLLQFQSDGPITFGMIDGSTAHNEDVRLVTDPADFAYAIPDGFDPVPSASNASCPEILNPDKYITTRISTGGAGVTDAPFSLLSNKAMVISKNYVSGHGWHVTDTVRGPGKFWSTDWAGGEITNELGLSAFTDHGFDIDPAAAAPWLETRHDFLFRCSSKAGFDMIGVINHVNGIPTTVSHNVGGVIDFAMLVPLDGGTIRMFHSSLPAGQYIPVNGTGAAANDTGWLTRTALNLTIGSQMPSGRYIIAAWRHVAGLQSFGIYTGNGSNDGPFVPMDFTPRLFLPRRVSAAANGIYMIEAGERNPQKIYAVLSSAAAATQAVNGFDFVSDGWKCRDAGPDYNENGVDYVYAAFGRTPAKFATAR